LGHRSEFNVGIHRKQRPYNALRIECVPFHCEQLPCMANPETRSLLFKDHDSELAHSSVSDTPSPEMLDLMLASRQTSARVAWNPYLHDPKLQDRLYRVKAPTLIFVGRSGPVVIYEAWPAI
jgi:hypothetical protein